MHSSIIRTDWEQKTPDEKQQHLVNNRLFLQKYQVVNDVEYVVFTKHSDDAVILPISQRNGTKK